MAKKIFALVAAVVLVVCFAVTVSAANVSTTTTYVAGAPANVSVTVSGVTENNNVTYYATNSEGEIFVDQKKVEVGATSVEFNYETDIANVGSAVKVGYTGANAEEGTILDADKYAIKYDGATLASVYPGEGATVTINYTPAAYTTVTSVTANGVALDVWAFDNNVITATVANVIADVELAVVTEVKDIPDYTEELVIAEAAAVVVKANDKYEAGFKTDAVKEDLGEFTPDSEDAEAIKKANADKVGDRKLTVAGKVGNFAKYGVIVSETAITEGNYRPADFEALGFAYEAKDKAPNNMFAVQLIDVSTATEGEAFVVEGTPYYVAVYGYVATEGNEAYYVKALATPVVAE